MCLRLKRLASKKTLLAMTVGLYCFSSGSVLNMRHIGIECWMN
ncbi:hypothetical protein E1A91_D07G249200v1 [Gossypium mustelinum]|uniref:Uncharacterized protein n=1 Tax=Gossypium mustelinum TaxID=34275 RepID=A0A5D2UBW9_GOSMU|nr:hypothetical protein E1A91_D07G249200v1 [Gossypium mustelinum]